MIASVRCSCSVQSKFYIDLCNVFKSSGLILRYYLYDYISLCILCVSSLFDSSLSNIHCIYSFYILIVSVRSHFSIYKFFISPKIDESFGLTSPIILVCEYDLSGSTVIFLGVTFYFLTFTFVYSMFS